MPWKKSHGCNFWIIKGDFLFYVENGLLCVLIRIASMREAIVMRTKTYIHVNENRKDIPVIPSELAL